MKHSDFKSALLLSSTYAFFSGLWIFFSDRLLFFLVRDPHRLNQLQTYKGLFFVVLSTFLIFILLRIEMNRRQRIEATLKESEEKYLKIFRASPDSIALTSLTDGRFLDANESFLRVSGYRLNELIGHTTSELDFWANPIERQRYIALLQTHGRVINIKADFCLKSGRIIIGLISGEIIELPDGKYVLNVIQDITARKQADEALETSERKYRELVEHANSIILRWRSDGKITFLNEFGQKFFGCTETEILGRHVVGTIVPDTESTGRDMKPLMEAILANPQKFEHNINENMRCNGGRVWIAWTNKVVLDEEGQVKEILSIGSDITERKRAEEDLQNLTLELEQRVIKRTAELQDSQRALLTIVEDLNQKTVELEQANVKLKELDQLKSMFIASMSHELRTPLNSIIGFTGIILQGLTGDITAEQRKQLSIVKESARHLLALINDIIDLSKIEAGKVEVELKEWDLSALIEEVKDSLLVSAGQKGLQISVEIPESLMVKSDQRRVKQVLVNLLGNAVKFTEQGTVHLSVNKVRSSGFGVQSEKDSISELKTQHSELHRDFVEISVDDTGLGIREEDLDRLFKPFSQITREDQLRQVGTGLGLYLSQKIAELLGGEIRVMSEVGEGSTFVFRIPGGRE
jgi:PAS domain S-box-containing protein